MTDACSVPGCTTDHERARRFDEAMTGLDSEYEPNRPDDGEPWSGLRLTELDSRVAQEG